MRVMVLGLRGFPGIQGGVETHAEHLYPLLVKLGCEVDVIVRSQYMPGDIGDTWRGVRFRRLWSPCPCMKGIEAFAHSFLGVLYAALKRPDVLHIHAIGPAFMTPLGRLFGLRVVVTHHGQDYDREKWGIFARWLLQTGERLGMRFADRRIVISKTIKEMVRAKYDRDSALIPNGVNIPKLPNTTLALQRFGLEPCRYVLLVSRFVPEKRHIDLIWAFAEADCPEWKLVLAGALDPPDDYIRAVLSLADTTPNIVFTGFQSGSALQELYANAGMFVLPSSHEGLPIVILEALSYGLLVLASDIPANLEVGLRAEHYFPLGDVSALAQMLRKFSAGKSDEQLGAEVRNWVKQRYNWERIAEQTLGVYEKMIR
jgi:glycosyltransferase involved in cell wall biosynthesis